MKASRDQEAQAPPSSPGQACVATSLERAPCGGAGWSEDAACGGAALSGGGGGKVEGGLHGRRQSSKPLLMMRIMAACARSRTSGGRSAIRLSTWKSFQATSCSRPAFNLASGQGFTTRQGVERAVRIGGGFRRASIST